MRKNLVEHNYYDTYYYCLVIQNVVRDPFSYAKKMHEILGEHALLDFLIPFKKESNLHMFTSVIIADVMFENFYELYERLNDEAFPYLNRVLELYRLDTITNSQFENFVLNGDYSNDWQTLIERMSNEVVQILFLNREFLLSFNQLLADYLEFNEGIHEYIADYNKNYNLSANRKQLRKAIPTWVKRAVFYRDKGCCVNCFKDLTGLVNLENTINYDHMIPLAKFGFNDVTNIQLLCAECNKEKLHHRVYTSKVYANWW